MPSRTHRVIIGVMGPAACDAATAQLARTIGWAIATRGAVLLTGGRTGVMEEACRGAKEAGGTTLGILPGARVDDTPPNPYVDLALCTGLGEGRNWVNVCASDAIIAIGGGFGTLSEIALALKARKPVVLVGSWRFEMDGVASAVARTDDPAHAVDLAFAALAAPPDGAPR